VCDVWEHAYFLKYHESMDKYADDWWSLINWDDVERRLISAVRGKLSMT